MLRLVVLISGSGTNLQAILDACARRAIDAEVVAVVSNRRKAYGLQRAKAAGVQTEYLALKPFKDRGETREAYDLALARCIENHNPDIIVLAGWMHILSPAFLERFPNRVVNLHPALPGQYPGTNAIARALEDAHLGRTTGTGVMVHIVVPEVDAGPVIATRKVPIDPNETLEGLEARMHACEHALLVEALGQLAADWPRRLNEIVTPSTQ